MGASAAPAAQPGVDLEDASASNQTFPLAAGSRIYLLFNSQEKKKNDFVMTCQCEFMQLSGLNKGGIAGILCTFA